MGLFFSFLFVTRCSGRSRSMQSTYREWPGPVATENNNNYACTALLTSNACRPSCTCIDYSRRIGPLSEVWTGQTRAQVRGT
jgi:hypothetical protein